MATKQEWKDYLSACIDYVKELNDWVKNLPQQDEEEVELDEGSNPPTPPQGPGHGG